jgi:poly(3-hydroxybutyrate) depolymerase
MRALPLVGSLLLACGPHIDVHDPADATGGATDSSGALTSRCFEDDSSLHCTHHSITVSPGGIGLGERGVHWQVPIGTAPAKGWPVVFMFQGSFFSANTFWDGAPSMPFGGWSQTHVTRGLLDGGYAVITPKTRTDGNTYWDTNVAPFSSDWPSSDDHHLLMKIFDGIAAGDFGPIDSGRMYATGISSGGYMTSRMAESYRGKFRALAIAAGAWATCGGALCAIPNPLPADHPPTLFMHGEKDFTVPPSTMRAYAAGLDAQSIENKIVTDPNAGHQWLPTAPTDVRDWFDAHP